MWIADAAHSREIDRRATEEYGLPAMVLMERAGLAVFDALKELLPESGSIGVVCGKGNNGGDGFVVARLAQAAGYAVECLVTAHETDLREECHNQMLQAQAQGVRVTFADQGPYRRRMDCLGRYDLIVDAILGIGAKGEVKGDPAYAIEAINRSGIPVLSVDVPSGIETDTGDELGQSVWALRTVTFGQPKPFLFQGTGLEHSGYWTVANIGFPRTLLNDRTQARLVDQDYVAGQLPERMRSAHKGANGHVLVVAGSHAMRGAAALAALAAFKSGAGLVTVAAVESVAQTVMAHCPEAVLLPLPETNGVIDPEAAELILQKQSRYCAALFGPGLTHDPPVLDFLSRLWSRWETRCVIDADALNAVAQGVALPPAPSVLTPHPGEMSRLLHSTIAEVQENRFAAVQEAIEKYQKTVLLKGPYSITGDPEEPLNVNQTGNSGMASAGMGDVLAGLIATLLAQDLLPYDAATCGMYWHGAAGDLCAKTHGPFGYTASDLAKAIPQARTNIVQPS